MKAPERACRLQLDIQADTRDEMVRVLEGIATAIDRGEMTTGCSGGVHSGWTYEYVERAGPTHQEYHEQLKAYLAAKRAEKETPAAPAREKTGAPDCEKCGGEGWCWGHQLDNPSEDTYADGMTRYSCDGAKCVALRDATAAACMAKVRQHFHERRAVDTSPAQPECTCSDRMILNYMHHVDCPALNRRV